MSVLRKAARNKEREEIKEHYGKRSKQRCPNCGKFSLFKWVSRQHKVVKCVRCGKEINLGDIK